MNVVSGDILVEGIGTVVIPVNRVGVLGAGLAKQWDMVAPKDATDAYRSACRNGFLQEEDFLFIAPNYLMFPTKNHWKDKSDWPTIKRLLREASEFYADLAHSSPNIPQDLNIPRLGCGLGGLKWQEVAAEFVETCLRCEKWYGIRITLFV